MSAVLSELSLKFNYHNRVSLIDNLKPSRGWCCKALNLFHSPASLVRPKIGSRAAHMINSLLSCGLLETAALLTDFHWFMSAWGILRVAKMKIEREIEGSGDNYLFRCLLSPSRVYASFLIRLSKPTTSGFIMFYCLADVRVLRKKRNNPKRNRSLSKYFQRCFEVWTSFHLLRFHPQPCS